MTDLSVISGQWVNNVTYLSYCPVVKGYTVLCCWNGTLMHGGMCLKSAEHYAYTYVSMEAVLEFPDGCSHGWFFSCVNGLWLWRHHVFYCLCFLCSGVCSLMRQQHWFCMCSKRRTTLEYTSANPLMTLMSRL